MKVDDFDFELPEERIALRPVSPRDASRLLVVKPNGLSDSKFKDFPGYFTDKDILVFNNTKVLPVRLSGAIGEGKVEATLLKPLKEDIWTALCKPGKRFKPGTQVDFQGLKAEVISKHPEGEITLQFHDKNVLKVIENKGEMPLPPYIVKKRGADRADLDDYQTVYAQKKGAIAAPTAGLHFTESVLENLQNKGVKMAHLTLHVGAGTFLPMKVDDTDDHVMHAEVGEITPEVAKTINEAKENGGRIIAVGTTSMRLLESATDDAGMVHPFTGETDIFITPGYRFKAVDMLLTNFHLPKSTLFMLVSAFSGLERMKAAYKHAIENNYRFYSYGDSSLLYKADGEV